jgi:hypothetical protein
MFTLTTGASSRWVGRLPDRGPGALGAGEQGALPFLLELDRVVGERQGDRPDERLRA